MTPDAGQLVQLGDVLDRDGAVDVGRLVRVSVADAEQLIAEGRAVPVADGDASPTAPRPERAACCGGGGRDHAGCRSTHQRAACGRLDALQAGAEAIASWAGPIDGRGGAAAVDDRAAGVYPLRFFRTLAAQGPRGRAPRGCPGLGDSGLISEKSPGDCRSGVPEGSRRG